MAEEKEKKQIGKSKFLVGTRGRTFEGVIQKKFTTRVVIELERSVYIQKYQRYYKKKQRLHARLPDNIDADVGDLVRIRECRPLSKIIHFIVTEKISSSVQGEKK